MSEKLIKTKVLLSGGRPTGKLHLGHYIGAFKKFAELQYDYNSYFILSDLHMLTTKSSQQDIKSLEENAIDMVIDSIAMGVDFNETKFYLQSKIPELTYIFILFQNYITYQRAISTPSFLEMKKHSGDREASLGLVAYPVMEAGDIFALNADFVPVGKDNVDHLRIAQEIIGNINTEFSGNFKIPQFYTDEKTNYLIGLDGTEKMSKTLDNAIYVRDTPDNIVRKINSTPWCKDSDKNVILNYLKVFDVDFLEKSDDYFSLIKNEKKAKSRLIDILVSLILNMQKRIQVFLEDREVARNLLVEGTDKTSVIVRKQLEKLISTLGLNWMK